MAWDDTFIYQVSKVTSAQMNAIIAKIKNILAEDIVFSDSTVGDVSTSKHGYFPKIPGGSGFLRADGVWAVTGTGGITGTTGTTNENIIVADGTGGATFKGSGATVNAAGTINIPSGQKYKINGTALAVGDITGAGTGNGTVTATGGALTADALILGAGTTDLKTGTNLPTATTIGGQYVYRAGGTDVPYTDGGTGISTYPKRTLWLSGEGGHLPTTTPAGAVTAVTETSTYKVNLKGTLHAASAADTFKEFGCVMPSNWDGGTVTGIPVFTTAGTDASNHTALFTLQGISYATTEANDVAWGTLQTSTYTFAASQAGKIIFGPETSAITIGGVSPAGGEFVQWRSGRTGSDTSTNDIILLGWKITYQTNGTSDS